MPQGKDDYREEYERQRRVVKNWLLFYAEPKELCTRRRAAILFESGQAPFDGTIPQKMLSPILPDVSGFSCRNFRWQSVVESNRGSRAAAAS